MGIIKLTKDDIISNKMTLKKGQMSYDSALANSWEADAKTSFETLQNYNTKLNNQEYFSSDDLKSYESAMNSYVENNNRLRRLNKIFGQGYTDEQEKEWNNAITSLQTGYKEASDYFSQFKDENEFKDTLAAIKRQEEMRDEDVEAGMAEINSILSSEKLTALKEEKARLGKGIMLSHRDNGVYLRKYGYNQTTAKRRFDELEKEIAAIEEPAMQKKEYLTQAKYLQNYFYLTENDVSLNEIESHLSDEDPIAYTSLDGNNITWKKLYDDKKYKQDLYARYEKYSAMPDWSEKSKYYQNNTKKTGADVSSFFDKDIDWRYEHTANYFPMPNKEDKYYSLQMTEKEKEVFNYIYHTQGEDAAYEWHDSIVDILKDRADEQYVEYVRKFAEKVPVLSDVTSVLANTFTGAEYIGNFLAGNGVEKSKLATFSETVRSTRAEQVNWEIGNFDAFDFIYNTGMSILDSGASMVAFGNAGGLALGLSAAAQGTNDALNRGMNNKQAFWNGLASGTFEMIFETISIGQFSTLKKSLGSGIKNIAKNIGKSMLVNASEETLTEIANILYDTMMNIDFSDYETKIRAYVASGMSSEEAKNQVKSEMTRQVAEAMASGAFMGLVFGGIGSVLSHRKAKAIESAYSKSDINSLINRGLSALDTNAYVLAQQAQEKINSGKSLSAQEIVDLQQAVMEAVSDADISKIKHAVETRLVELGEGKAASAVADAIAKQVLGQKLTAIEKSTLKNSKYGQRVANEIAPKNIASGDYSSDWAKDIGTELVNRNVYNRNLQSNTDDAADNDDVVAQQGGQSAASAEIGAIRNNTDRAAPGVVKETDGRQYFNDDRGNEYLGDIDSADDRASHLTTAVIGGNSLDLGLSEPAISDITRPPTSEESIATAISGEQLDTKQRRILDFVEQHFPEITLKFSSNMTKDGLWDPESKTLLLNTNQTVAGMYTEVFKHEFMHRLESKRLYQEFKQFLFNKDTAFGIWAKAQCKVHGIELTQNATASEAISKLTEYYHDSVKNDMAIAKKYRDAFTVDGAQREMVADFFGEIMFNGKKYRTQTAQALADETFITIFDESERAEFQASSMAALAEIAEYKPNIFRQIVDWVKRIILKLRGTRIKADAILADELERNIKMLEDYVKQVYNSRDTKKPPKMAVGVEYQAIKRDANGNSYWHIDSEKDIFKNIKNAKKLKEAAYNYILHGDKGNKVNGLIDGQNLEFIRVSANEYVYGKQSQKLEGKTYKQKMRISPSIIDLIENADIKYDAPDHKNHKLFPNGFKNYQGRVGIDDTIFRYIVRVGKAKSGMIFYDINLEVDVEVPSAKSTSLLNKSTSTTNIPNSTKNVKSEISNDNNNDSSNSNQNPSFAVTSQMQQLRYNPEAYAKYILRRYGSKADSAEVATLVRQIVTESNKGKKTVDVNADGEVGYTPTHTRLINELSRKIADGIEPPVADYAQDVLDEIHDGAISLDERQKAEIEYEFGSLKEFKRQTGVKISEDGLPLDVKWQQWADQMPNVFEAETTSPDMPSRLADIVEKMKSSTDEVDIAAISQQIAYEIQHTLDNTGSKATNRRIAEARKEGVAQGKEIERKRSDKIITNQQTIINKYRAELKTIEKETLDKERERREQSEDRASNRRAIERNLRHLDHLLRSNTNARHIPEQLNDVIRKICKLFLDNSSTVFLSEEIKDIRAYYGEYVISEGLKDDMVSNDVLTMFELLKSELIGKTLNQVSDEGMEIIRFVTDYFNNLVNEENKAFINGKKEDMAVLGQAAFDAIENKKVPKMLGALKSTNAEKVREFLYEGNITPYYLFKRLGKPFLRIFNDLIAGQNRATQNMDIAAAKFEEVKQKRNYKAWKNDIFEHTTERGVKLTLTVEQLLQIYATSRREQSNKVQRAKHLLGGIVLDQKAIKEAAKSKKSSGEDMQKLRSKAIKLSAKDIAELSALLTDEQRGYADDIVEFMSTWCAALGNEVTMQLYGYRKYTDRYYIPYVSAQEFLEYNVLKGEQKLMKSPSFSKSLEKNANNPLLIQGFSQVAAKHIDTMCGYNGMAVAIDTLHKMLNHNNLNSIKGEEGETAQAESVWAAIDRVYGSGMVNVLKNFIADVNNGVTEDRKYNVFNKLFRTFKKTAVMANLSVAIQQPIAIVKTVLLMNPKYLFTKVGNKSELWAECCLYAPIASLKQHGQFHGEGGTHNIEWILGNDLDTTGEKVKDLFSKDSKTRDDYLGKLAEKGDQVAWIRIWAAVKAELADSGKYDTTSKEYLEACGERFTEIIVRTQVYDSVLSRSQNMRDKGIIGSMTAFMMEPSYAINIVGDAIIEYAENPNQKNAKQLFKTVIVMSSTELAVAIAKSFITAMRDDDDEDETYLEKYVEAVTANFLNGINPISKVPFLADIYSNIEGYTTERSDMQVISDLINAFDGLSSKKTTVEKIVNLVNAVSNAYGIPVKNVYRDIKGLVNTIISFADFEMPKGTEIVESVKKGANESFAIANGIKKFGDYIFDTIEVGDYLKDLKDNETYKSFDDDNKQAVKEGICNFLADKEKFERAPIKIKAKQFEDLYEVRRKHGKNSLRYRKERKKMLDSGIDEKDLNLGIEIAKFKYLEKNGITVAEYYAAKTELNRKNGDDNMVYDTDSSGGLNKKEIQKAIDNMKGFGDNEKDILFEQLKP